MGICVWKIKTKSLKSRTTSKICGNKKKCFGGRDLRYEVHHGLTESPKQKEPARRVQGNATWRPPLRGWTKCNTDASFSLSSSRSSTTAVFRDHEGKLLTATTSNMLCSTPLAAEAMALRDAMIISRNLQIDKILFEYDSLNLIQAIKSKTSIPEIDTILEDLWEISRSLSECGFISVPRSCNSLAHEIAKLSAAGVLSSTWSFNQPSSISSIIQAESRRKTVADPEDIRD
ncbi:hypothetical protein PIB30_046846 [Stylosanthes scabra]|uniref:RNase H type-1 domain-containing protein n=1 Tax=Stylosanthes scabra TaxID=79078 RepID=A0ABU6XGU8_9FABA|nr:hypothetical protein [Stylosanthes scabra]